jgi:G3E family GTPase
VQEQLCFADKIILNKLDLVPDAAAVERVVARLRRYNPTAEIILTTRSIVPPEQLLGLDAFSLDKVLAKEPEFLAPDQEHLHDTTVTSVSAEADEPMSVALLESWIGELLKEQGEALLRYKGVLSIAGMDKRFVFQGVHMLFEGGFTTAWGAGEPRRSRFVFIGRNLPKEAILAGFASCKAGALRFAVGARVLANVGTYKPGTVLRQWHEGNAYQINVDGYGKVWAPVDDDAFVKAA